MKLRTRLAAMVLTILLTAQLPVSVFANSAASTAQTQGQIVVTDENGQEQILTAEQLQSGENLPENIVINNETTQTQETETPAPASDSAPAASSTSTPAASDSAPAASSTSAPAASESAPAANSTSAPAASSTSASAASESTPTASSEERVDLDLPLVQNTDDKTQRVDLDLPLVQATDTTGNRVEETVSVNQAASSDSAVPSDEEEEKEEVLPYIYWNPGEGYDVDPSYLETQKAESDSTSSSTSESVSESESTGESASASQSASASDAASQSVPVSGGTSESGSASGSTSESVPASGSTSESVPASGSTSESSSASGSTSESASASGSTAESGSASGSTSVSTSAPSSTPESGSASGSTSVSTSAPGSTPESVPASSSAAVSTPAPSSTPEAAQVPGTDAAAEPAPQPVHEAAPEAGFVEQAGQVLDNLSPVQTAHAADTLEPEQEKGFFAGVLEWLSWLFSPITRFFKDLAAFALSSNYVPEGDDANTGRSPLAPVKSFDAAMQRARELSAELGITVDQVTIYMMNPLEIKTGQQVDINTNMAILKAWEGRNYDSDMLFYLTGGTLSVNNTVMTPRAIDPANMQDAAKTLVWLYGGTMVLESNVSAYGGFVLDFYQQESARVWNTAASLAAQKYETPVIRLGESFAPVGMGYAIQFKESDREVDQLELVQAPYADEAKMQEYAKSFTVTGETASEWEYEVMAQQQAQAQQAPAQARTMARMAVQDGGKTSASASLYAVRASGVVIYWNPGGQLTINGSVYPAGSDVDRTGLAPSAPLKTLTMAIEMAKKNNTTRIVCMRTLEINKSTANTVILEKYLPYDEGTKTFQLHSDLISGVPVDLMNWDQGLPVLNVADGYNLSIQNVTLQGYATETTNRVGNLLTVGVGSTVTLNDRASVIGGSYIQVSFDAAAGEKPNPIMVNSQTGVSATIYASGIAFAPHFSGTPLVQATEELVNTAFKGDKVAAGKALAPNFALDKANTTPSTEGGQNQVIWSLEQSVTADREHTLVLTAAKDYSAIYVDPERGDDSYDGITCEFPVKTVDRALALLQQTVPDMIEKRKKAHEAGANPTDIDDNYPLPGLILICSTVEINDEQNWNWSQYHWEDYNGQEVRPVIMAHDDAADGATGKLHTRPEYLLRVGAGGSLTLGEGVRIGRSLPDSDSITSDVSVLKTNVINVVDGGSLTLTSNAELFGTSEAAEDLVAAANLYKTYPGVAIVAGVQTAFHWTPSVPKQTTTAATVTLDSGWTGAIHGFSRGVLLCGQEVTMTMDAGNIYGNKNNYTGAGVSLFQGAQFTMNGGKIRDNYAAIGAGVLVDAYQCAAGEKVTKFTMKAGAITGNTIDRYAPSYISTYMGGAGVQTYYGEFEMGTKGADNSLCVVSGNCLRRRRGITYNNVLGVGISLRNNRTPNKQPSFIMHSGTVSGNLVDDQPDLNLAQYLYVYGIGIGTYSVSSLLIEGGEISENRLENLYNDGNSYACYFFGAGMHVGAPSDVPDIVIRNLTVKNNSLSEDYGTVQAYRVYFYGGGLSFSYELSNYTNNPVVLLENVQVLGNAVKSRASGGTSALGGGIDFQGSQSTYASDVARLLNVTVRGNQATNGGGIYGSFHWAKNLTVTENTAANSGGGWYTGPAGSNYAKRQVIVEDSVFTKNTANNGGGIYFNHVSKDGYTYTITESAPGKTKIQENTASSYGGGVYMAPGSGALYYFDFTSEWNNTVTDNDPNTRGQNLYVSYLYNAAVYLLQGTFLGTDSICILPTTGNYNGTVALDMTKVKFTPDEEGQSAIYLNHPNGTITLLAAGSSASPLHLTINEQNFNAGNVIFKPGNVDKLEIGGLSKNEAQQGGYEAVAKSYSYPKLTDASQSSKEGETSSDYITLTGTPVRTQLGAMADVSDETLTNLALIGEGVYLDGMNGKDTNKGLSPKDAVKTWEKAAQLMEQYQQKPPMETQKTTGFQPIIWMCGPVTLEKDAAGKEITLSLPQSVVSETYQEYEKSQSRTPERAAAKRFASNNLPLFYLEDGAVVNVTNLRVDGNSAALTNALETSVSFHVKSGGLLKVGDGARIYESYGPNVSLYGGSLEVDQSFTPTQTDTENDEKYGIQISSDSKRSSGSGAVTFASDNSSALLKGNAYLGNTSPSGGSRIFYVMADHASITMQGDSIIRGSSGIYRYYRGNIKVHLKDNALMDNNTYGIYSYNNYIDSTLGLFEMTMEGKSHARVTGSSNSFWYEYGPQSAAKISLYDEAQITGRWVQGTSYQSAGYQKGSMSIIMGRQGGEDAPVIDMLNGTLSWTGGQLYLEMNANAQLKGAVQFSGLSAPVATDVGKPKTYGIVMRDNASIVSTNYNYGVELYMYYYSSNSTNNRSWDKTTPFTIHLTDNASIGYSSNTAAFSPIRVYQSISMNAAEEQAIKDRYMMGDDQTIVLSGNAKLKGYGYYGAIYSYSSINSSVNVDPDDVTPISTVIFKDNAGVEQTTSTLNSSSYSNYPLISARKVVLQGNVSLPKVGNQAVNTSIYGQGASVKAWEMELDGTAEVKGPIWLLGKNVADGTTGNITLTAPIASTADTGRYQLHLAANCMGQIVVAPGGTVQDASIYLDCFTKLAAEGEAADVDLKAMKPNIVLDRQWNVYLSSYGNDTNDGSTPQKAVRTFTRAKEILTTVEGYGNGSNIIIPDNLTIQNHDKTWSFEAGGVLTSATGEKWKPSVRRMDGIIYTMPLITVSAGAYSTSAANGKAITAEEAAAPVVFENITIDDGGSGGKFALSGTGYNQYNFSMVYVNTGVLSREVQLGENVVLHNLDYDPGTATLAGGWYVGGFALNIFSGKVTMNGAVIEDFSVKNYSHESSSNSMEHTSIISVNGTDAALEMKEGAIRDNLLDIKYRRNSLQSNATAILAVANGATFNMSGGEFSGNTLQGPLWTIPGNSYAGSADNQRTSVGVICLSGSGSAMTLSGGKITGNANRLGIDETPAKKNFGDVENIITVGTQGSNGGNESSGVYQGCTFTMSGGSITNNTARYGSAFALLNGTVTLSGGTIRGNESVAPVPTGGEPTGWKAEYCPIFVSNFRTTRLNLQGSGCVADDPFYLQPGRQIVLTDQLRQTNRLYEIYTGTGSTPAGNLVVIPDGDVILDATPYLHNFHAHAAGMVLDRGRESKQVTTQLGQMDEQKCLLQMKAVFVNGDKGTDPDSVDLSVPQNTLGRNTDDPVQTFDAAKAIGQALCYEGEDPAEHASHRNHYVVYATGTVYNDLYEGQVTDTTGVYTKNEDASNFVFSFDGAAYMCRYTGWALCRGNGLHKTGSYCYDSLIKIRESTGTTTLKNIILRGRREVDSTDNNGETLVVVGSGSKLILTEGAGLERNNVAGSRPSAADPSLMEPINTKGGGVRVEAGGEMLMDSGIIDITCTAITGSSIYLMGKEDAKEAAKLTLQNKVNIGGEIYLGGQQGYDTPILVDKTFAPTQSVAIGIQGDYNLKPVVQWTDDTEVTEEMLKLFTFSTSITALYEVLPGNVSNPGEKNNAIVLNLRNILYLDPDNGDDKNDGKTPEKAIKTIGRIYDMFKDAGSVPGVLVFVMNPIEVPEGTLLAITNGSVQQGMTKKYISIYYEGAEETGFDTTVGIHHADNEKQIQSQLYFKRYVKTSDAEIPENYDAETNWEELFIVKGQLQLNGVYLDGHSNATESTYPGQSAPGIEAKAPLVRVDDIGSAQFLAGELKRHQLGDRSYQAGNTLFTNNVNNNLKTKTLPGTNGVVEGSGAGIEILSSGTDQGFEKEKRGKVVLLNTQFVNLKLGEDKSGKGIIGGSDVYQNGELTISNNVYFEGNIFLEGNGRNGDTEEDRISRQTSRWLGISAYGSPVAGAFELLVRDAYHNRRMVKYPYSTSNTIPQDEISYYMLTSEVSRYFTLMNELIAPGTSEEDFLGTGENTLWLRVPQAVYIDPENGNDKNNGQHPETAVKTLQMAFERMRGLSAKVLYVVNTIPIDGMSFIYPTGYSYDGGVVALPSNNVHLEIRRYVQPDNNGGSGTYYKVPSFTDGPLFRVEENGQLTIEGSVVVNGHSEPLLGKDVPPAQKVSNGVSVTAPLVQVLSGGTFDLNIDSKTGERASLIDNNNTAALGTGQTRMEGGAINNKGSVILNGGVLDNNKAALVASPGITAQGSADGVYQAGDMTVSAYPQGLEGQSIFLASDVSENDDGETNFIGDHILTMDMRLKDEVDSASKKLTYSLDMDNAVPGRQVISYPGDSQVDSEHSSYILGKTVHEELFLVESEDTSGNLELQDWTVLNVSVPEEVFLAVYEHHNRDDGAPYGSGAYTQAGRADVDGAQYGVPEYTITNNGLYGAKVTVTGFIQKDWQKDTSPSGMQLAQSTTDLSSASPLLYMALTKSSETEEQGNQFANLAEASLKAKTSELSVTLGTLQSKEHGSFAFKAAANAAFMDLWTDTEFPVSSFGTAQDRRDYMRNKDALGEASLNKASAQFKLTYRIEIDPARR